MADREFQHGWKTHVDGTRTPITKDEADRFMAMLGETDKRRAEAYPTTDDALSAFIDADQRLRSLGWVKSIFRLEDGAELALIQAGSTGVFRAFWNKPYLHYQGCVSSMGKHYIKRVADLTDDERAKMAECDESHNTFMEHHTASMARLAEFIADATPPPKPQETP